MAGIGFELKKLFRRKGLFASLRAYGYAGIICTGPMLLGIALQMGILLLCSWAGASRSQQDLLVCMVTYTLLFSLTVTSFFSMPVTRYLADMLYAEQEQNILPSFWGSNALMLVLGCVLYGVFLIFSGATLLQGLLCLWLFAEMIVNWNGMSYLTAIKDYRGILFSFLAAIGVSFGLGYLLVFWLGFPVLEGMLFAVTMGYGLMMVWDVVLLYRYFPQSDESPWTFLRWIDQFLPLSFTGLLTNIGLFSHLVICWFGPVGVQVKGLFYGAPYYDVPALIAFLTILITSINFVVSVEVNFYPKYRDYYSLFNDGGVVGDIVTAEEEMLAVLSRELRFTALKQLFVTAAVISLEGTLLDLLPLGFNDLMHGYFRTLCVGYGLYAVGNTVLLILLYFTDYLGAVLAAAVFAVASGGLTALSLLFSTAYYGFGFLIGAALFYVVALFRLDIFTANLPYRVLGCQPITEETKAGVFTRLGLLLEKHTEKPGRIWLKKTPAEAVSPEAALPSQPPTGGSSPKGGNDFDRRQWRKQGEIVGAAASGMQAEAKQTLGAATRVQSTSGVSVKPTLDEKSSTKPETAVPRDSGQAQLNNTAPKPETEAPPQPLPLGEVSPKVTERVSQPTETPAPSDKQELKAEPSTEASLPSQGEISSEKGRPVVRHEKQPLHAATAPKKKNLHAKRNTKH